MLSIIHANSFFLNCNDEFQEGKLHFFWWKEEMDNSCQYIRRYRVSNL